MNLGIHQNTYFKPFSVLVLFHNYVHVYICVCIYTHTLSRENCNLHGHTLSKYIQNETVLKNFHFNCTNDNTTKVKFKRIDFFYMISKDRYGYSCKNSQIVCVYVFEYLYEL